jgi:hypothetical protein
LAFSDEVRTKVLLWSDRHCCLCKKACGTNIEIHHIVPVKQGGTDEIDNAIPLCFDCHSDVMRYNDEHPKGSKFKAAELKSRRDQVYEEFTRHLVPPVDAQITQLIPVSDARKRTFPDVGFLLRHLGTSLPVQVRVLIESVHGATTVPFSSDYYSGRALWNLNPGFQFSGHFNLNDEIEPSDARIELRVTLTVIDQYGREHALLPVSFVWAEDGEYWYAEP